MHVGSIEAKLRLSRPNASKSEEPTIKLAADITLEDDWYAVQPIDADTLAIGEPRYYQQNWSYLIRGGERDLLFDTGSFMGDITGVVARHSAQALTVLPSHMHFDHLGNVTRFDRVAVAELAELRACCDGDMLTPTEELFLGSYEDRTAPAFQVSEWLAIGSVIDLGGRRLDVLHTPGHSPDSISLYDRARDQFFAADYMYPGDLYAQVPGASLPDYLTTARDLLELTGPDTRFLCAHGNAGEEDTHTAPILGCRDLEDLHAGLRRIRGEAAGWPDSDQWREPLSDRLALLVGPGSVSQWR